MILSESQVYLMLGLARTAGMNMADPSITSMSVILSYRYGPGTSTQRIIMRNQGVRW